MTAGKSKQVNCPRCQATHNEYRLTCRRCGHYLQTIDDANNSSSAGGSIIVGLILVALVGGFACYMLFNAKPSTQAPDASTQKPAQVESTTSTPASTKKRGKRRKRAH